MTDTSKFETSGETVARVTKALGFDAPDALDVVDRNQYADEDSYLDAVALETMRRNNPEFAAARRTAAARYRERQAAAERERQRQEYGRLRASVKLDSVEAQAIDRRAREMAGADVMARRISAADLSESIEKHKKALTEQKKDSKAAAQQMNNLIRGR